MMSSSTSEKFCPLCSVRVDSDSGSDVCAVDGSTLLPVVQDALIGQIVDGKFELLNIIGTGGFSTVYRARQIGLDRFVAFKLLRADLVSTVERIKRFEQEAHLASSLNHKNICAVYDCGILETGQPYLVMENVEGQNLERILEDGRVVPESRALRLVKQIAEGLQIAHEQGILHRDLKPGNIMIVDSTEGELIKIIDFGLAKLFGIESKEHLSIAGETMGTPAYMSPEQVQGKALDARSDIYAFGCIIYEMLSGMRAVEGKSAFEVMLNHLHNEPPPLTSGDRVVPIALRELTAKCLSKDPAQRYPSAKAIYDDIERIEKSGVLEKGRRRKIWRVPFESSMLAISATVAIIGILCVGYKFATAGGAALVKPMVNQTAYTPLTIKTMTRFDELMGNFQLVAGEQVGKSAYDALVKSGKQFSPDMVLVSRKMLTYHLDGGRRTQAIPYINAWLAAKEHLAPAGSEELIDVHRQAAHDFQRAVQEQDALIQYKKVVALNAERFGKTSPQYYSALYELAGSNLRSEKFADAQQLFSELSHLKGSRYDVNGDLNLSVLCGLCDSYVGLQDSNAAKHVAELAIQSVNSSTPAPMRMLVYKTAASAAERRHDYKQAIELIDKAIETSRLIPDRRSPTYVTDELIILKGSYLRQDGNLKDADAVLRSALTQIVKSHQPESNEYRFCQSEYVKLLRATSREKEALKLERTGRL